MVAMSPLRLRPTGQEGVDAEAIRSSRVDNPNLSQRLHWPTYRRNPAHFSGLLEASSSRCAITSLKYPIGGCFLVGRISGMVPHVCHPVTGCSLISLWFLIKGGGTVVESLQEISTLDKLNLIKTFPILKEFFGKNL